MGFKPIILILACAMAAMASPLTVRHPTEVFTPNEYTELFRENTSTGGSLVYYGPIEGTKTRRSEAGKVAERASCGTAATPSYYTSHTARNGIYDELVTELYDDSTVAVRTSPRQICYEGDATDTNEWCYVSWHNAVSNLIKNDLANYANASKLFLHPCS